MEGNPAPIDKYIVYPIIYKFVYIPGGCLGFLPSTVFCGFVWYFVTWLLLENSHSVQEEVPIYTSMAGSDAIPPI